MSKKKVRRDIDFITDDRHLIEASHDDVTEDIEGPTEVLRSDVFSVDDKLKAAQEQLIQLRLQQEEIESQKKHLALLRIKQERFVNGKREIFSNIERAIGLVEEQLLIVQSDERRSHGTSKLLRGKKRVKNLTEARELLNKHREILKSLMPEKWHRCEVDSELDRGLSAIEDAYHYYYKFIREERALCTELDPNIPNLEDTWHGKRCRLFASVALGIIVITAFTSAFAAATIVLAISAAGCALFAALHFYYGLQELLEATQKSESLGANPKTPR